MDIGKIVVTPSAQIFKIVKIFSKRQLTKLYSDCSEKKIGAYVINEKKVPISINGKEVIYSIMAFKMESQPNFLINTTIKEIRYAYLLILEHDDYAFIFKKNVDISLNKLLNFLNPFPYEKLTGFKANQETEYEKVSLNSMTISNAVIRNRAYEGKNLKGLLPSTSASRSIASNFRLNCDGEIYSIIPNTSRLSFRSPRLSIKEISQWCVSIKNELETHNNGNTFIDNFASPVDLEKVSQICHPTAIFVDLEDLDLSIREHNDKKLLYVDENKKKINFDDDQLRNFFNLFKSPINLIKNCKKSKVFDFCIRGNKTIGNVILNKNIISFYSRVGNNIIISDENAGDVSFSKFINTSKCFSVVFSHPSYMYFSRYTFQDKKLLSNIDGMLSIFIDKFDFSNVKSEKEKPFKNKNISEFPVNSLFFAVERNLKTTNSIIICDDMNDEWADHIILEGNTVNAPCITYVHSKFVDNESYGASKFHEVVSQALKNLGRLNSDVSEYKIKYDNEWKNKYESTNIERVRTGNDWNEIEKNLTEINSNPNSLRKIILATPFLKKSILQGKMEQLAKGEKVPPHYIQILWLINTFISACRDYNVQPYILCKA